MAPIADITKGLLSKRQTEYCGYGGCYSTWNNWGRWVSLVVIIIIAILVAFFFSRRRRRRGLAPRYGTGWIPYTNYNSNPINTNKPPGYPGSEAHPPPPYMGNQATGNTFNSDEGYYGRHNDVRPQNEFELQQPSSSYQPHRGLAGDDVYEAPNGPPPKGGYTYSSPDGIVR